MPAPTRLPKGISTAAKNSELSNFPAQDPTKVHTYFNDFDVYTAGDWTQTATSVGAGTSAITIDDSDGGVALVTTAANENDGIFIESQGESFLLESGKKTWIKARLFVGDAIESDLIVGLHSTSVTPQAATMRFLFESVDGSAALYFNSDNNTTDSDSSTVATLADDTWVVIGAYYDGVSSISLYLNEAKITTMTDITVPAAEMAIGFGYLNGAAGAETAGLDYLLVSKER